MTPVALGKRGIAVAFAAMIVMAAAGRAQGLMVSGYADIEYHVTNLGSDNGTEHYFDNHHFNLIFLGNIIGDLFAAAEVEYEHAGEEIALEYGYLAYTGFKNIRLIGGKFIVPFGRFNKDLHPSWINKMVDRPWGFSNIFPQTYSDVGVWVSGGLPLGAGATRLTYDGFIVNGLLGDDGGDIRDFRDNDREKRTGTRDKNKAVGGRLGMEFAAQGLDFGVSIYNGNYANDSDEPPSSPGKLDLLLLGADAAFRRSGLEIRVEVVTADQDASAASGECGTAATCSLSKTGGYAQVAYLIGTSNFEPVVRFSTRNMPQDSDDRSRYSFGINYYISAASAVRLNYHINSEKSAFKTDNDAIAAQFTVGF